MNLSKVYISDEKNKYECYYNIEDKSMTIYSNKGKIDKESLESDEKLERMVTHDGTHAVLRLSEEECLEYGIKEGTGIYYVTNEGLGIGKGLNEGLTNWIDEKAGIATKNYTRLTKLVKILEIAIGKEKVMRLGKGDIDKNIPKNLNMSKEECIKLFMIADDIFELEEQLEQEQNDADIDEIYRILRSHITRFLNVVYSQYFKKDIKKIIKPIYRISDSEMKKFKVLKKLCADVLNIESENEETRTESETEVEEFVNSGYNKLLNKYYKEAVKENGKRERGAKQREFAERIKDMSKYNILDRGRTKTPSKWKTQEKAQEKEH